MTSAIAVAAPVARFAPWRDLEGREHSAIPRCEGRTKARGASRRSRSCRRRGVVKRGVRGGREAWFCLQHDPERLDERRAAALATALFDLVRDGLDLMPSTKESAAWRSRAEVAVARVESCDRSGCPGERQHG